MRRVARSLNSATVSGFEMTAWPVRSLKAMDKTPPDGGTPNLRRNSTGRTVCPLLVMVIVFLMLITLTKSITQVKNYLYKAAASAPTASMAINTNASHSSPLRLGEGRRCWQRQTA
jgi:hypothetical protein